jgi:hypothetical protein
MSCVPNRAQILWLAQRHTEARLESDWQNSRMNGCLRHGRHEAQHPHLRFLGALCRLNVCQQRKQKRALNQPQKKTASTVGVTRVGCASGIQTNPTSSITARVASECSAVILSVTSIRFLCLLPFRPVPSSMVRSSICSLSTFRRFQVVTVPRAAVR